MRQTGKYVVCAEDLPRANKISCTQRPIKRAEFEKCVILYGEGVRGWFFQARKFDDENIFCAQKTNFPVWTLRRDYGSVYNLPFSYEDDTEMFRFGLSSTLYRFPIRHQMKTVA